MSQQFYLPSGALRGCVKSICVIEERPEVFNRRLILPQPYPGVLISLGAPLVWEQGGGARVEMPRVFFSGVQTRPLKVRAAGAILALGVELYAWGARLLVDDGVDLAAAPVVPMGGRWAGLAAALRRPPAPRESIALLEQFLGDHLRRPGRDLSAIRGAVEQLHHTRGASSVAALAARAYLSPSQLERQSRYFTGVSPKTLARLIRFEAACGRLVERPDLRMTDLVHHMGYSDQAHFIREFRAFAGRPPGQAVAALRRMATDADFVQFF